MQTLVSFMERTIAKKNTLFGAKLKLVFVLWMKMRPTGTPEHFKKSVVGRLVKQLFNGGLHVKDTCRKPINQETSGNKGITPKEKRK